MSRTAFEKLQQVAETTQDTQFRNARNTVAGTLKAVTEGRFAHNVAAVDAQRAMDENLDHETPLSELFEDQIACADMIVVMDGGRVADKGTHEELRERCELYQRLIRTQLVG